jgi:hypothetical protein
MNMERPNNPTPYMPLLKDRHGAPTAPPLTDR